MGIDKIENLSERVLATCGAAEGIIANDDESAPGARKGHVQTRLLAQEPEPRVRIRAGDAVDANLGLAALERIDGAAADPQPGPFVEAIPDDVLKRLDLCDVPGNQGNVVSRFPLLRNE